ncbi:hypothetical protein YC2023_089266 [Brassica napus]
MNSEARRFTVGFFVLGQVSVHLCFVLDSSLILKQLQDLKRIAVFCYFASKFFSPKQEPVDPAVGEGANSCDMAWRYRPKDGKSSAFYKDYRRFVIQKSDNCTLSVATIGEYHSGLNARKRKRNQKAGFEKSDGKRDDFSLPLVGEAVNDSLPTVESDKAFTSGKYLVYVGGGDRCKSMNHFLWSFLCALGEAQYLNRTLVMYLTLCLSSVYTSSGQSEEGKDFRFYFDFEHLKEAASVLDEAQFWAEWGKLHNKKTRLGLHLVEDFRVTPMKLSDVKDTLF